MSTDLLSLGMDFVVLLALAGTIYFVMRLSRALNNFKAHREEMKILIMELSTHIDQAQSAVINLKSASDGAANDLDDVLHDGRRMAEELKMINEASDSLASRLENLAQGARQARESQPEEYAQEFTSQEFTSQERPLNETQEIPDMPSFFIQDTDIMQASRNEGRNEEGHNDSGDFNSLAEKELYDALKKNKTPNRHSSGGQT